MRNELKSFEAIRKAIRYTTGENGNVAMFTAVVSAIVGGKSIISEDTIKVHLAIHYDKSEVSVFWEDYGYKNYKNMGLYGLMNSDYQDFIDIGLNKFQVVGDRYTVVINYNGATSNFTS